VLKEDVALNTLERIAVLNFIMPMETERGQTTCIPKTALSVDGFYGILAIGKSFTFRYDRTMKDETTIELPSGRLIVHCSWLIVDWQKR